MPTAVDPSAVARVVGIETSFRDLRANNIVFLPQRVAVIGQGASAATFSTTKAQHTSSASVGQTYGFGSPVHLAALQLLPENGDGVGTIPVTFYPLEDAGGAATAAGDLTPSGSATVALTFRVVAAGVQSEAFTVAIGDSVATMVTAATAAINATLNFPLIATDNATDVGLAAKWAGASANDIVVSVVGSTNGGVTWAITQPAGGATNPDIQPALDQVGSVWESMFVNCMERADTTTLDAYSTFGEGRWGALVKKPAMVFTGTPESSVSTLSAFTDARPTDRTNILLPAPGSANLPLQIAARAVARAAVVANQDPPHDYARQTLTGLTAGTDGEQWTYPERDQAVKAGLSTTEVRDGVIALSDTVTMYHPAGDLFPAYRYAVDIVKLQQLIFNLNLIFESTEWDGAPLVPDDQPVLNRSARQPKAARAAIAGMLDRMEEEAIISDAAFSKQSIVAEIDGSNPKRLNIQVTVKLSGNSNIISINLDFGFFFGGVAA